MARGPTPCLGVGQGPPAPRGCGCPGTPLRLPSGLLVPHGKLLTLTFVPSNSENISLLAFLEPKTAENRQLALWQLVNRLVMTHKCRGLQLSSRVVLPNLLIRHKGSQRILATLTTELSVQMYLEIVLAHRSLSVATVW